jgi:AraC-like DNA-binding protein
MSGEPGFPRIAFEQLLNSRALSPHAADRFRVMLDREDTCAGRLPQLDGQVPVRWIREVFPRLDTDQAVLLGWSFAEHAQLTSFGPLSIPLISAGSVTEIIELLAYLPLISTAVTTRSRPVDDGLLVAITGHTGDGVLDCLVVTYCGATLLRLIQMLVDDVSAVSLHSSWPAPPSLLQHERSLPGHLLFDAPLDFLHVPAATLNDVCRFSDPTAYRLALEELRRTLGQKSMPRSLSEEVRLALEHGSGLKSSRAVASDLSISVSTLKRRLAEEGTTYRDLLERSLLERATLHLLDSSITISQIAAELGYGDLTNFSHAFKRWTGQSPTQFRLSHQPSDA